MVNFRMRFVPAVVALALLATSPARAEKIQSIAAGDNHSMVIMDDGSLWTWGLNDHGQLGNGKMGATTDLVKVAGIGEVKSAAGGAAHTVALKSDGTVWTWGANSHGQLGDGTVADRATPARVEGLEKIIAVSAGAEHSLALKEDGTVWAWGMNRSGELGDGRFDNVNPPVEDRDVSGAKTSGGAHHSIAMKPVQVKGLSGVKTISAGAHHNIAMKADGSVWAWGANGDGRLGDRTTVTRRSPVQIIAAADAPAMVVAGGYHNVALQRDGTLLAWGNNWSECWQLANATTMNCPFPVAVIGLENLEALGWPVIPTKEPFKPFTDATMIAAGAFDSAAIKKDGSVWVWGQNARWGQQGNGAADWFPNPVRVRLVENARAVAVGKYHCLALTADGTLWTWGGNSFGQLGSGSPDWEPHPVPQLVPALRQGK